jgi:hypothetical protein
LNVLPVEGDAVQVVVDGDQVVGDRIRVQLYRRLVVGQCAIGIGYLVFGFLVDQVLLN